MLVSQSVSQSTNYTYVAKGHMLWDNALKFYMDQAYDNPQKPMEIGQYMNNNQIRKILDGDHMLHLGNLKW